MARSQHQIPMQPRATAQCCIPQLFPILPGIQSCSWIFLSFLVVPKAVFSAAFAAFQKLPFSLSLFGRMGLFLY